MDVLSPIALTLFFAIAFAFLLLKFSFGNEEPKNLPHGSMGWPLCGETLAFLKPHRSNTMGSFLHEHCSRYGRIFKSHLFGSPSIVSCDLELNMFILQNEGKLFESCYPKPLYGILGNSSLILVHGDLHKKLRNFAVSFINSCRSRTDFLCDVENMVVAMMESWRQRKEVFFCEEAKKFTFNIIVKQLLSIEPGEPLASKILEDFLTFMQGFVSLPIYIPGTSYAKAVKARGRISATIREIIRQRQKGEVGTRKGDFLDGILLNSTLSEEEKVGLVLDLMLAGYETTATLMPLVLYFLAHSPRATKRIKEEQREIRRRKEDGEPLNLEDYKQMKFTYNVICEALRCGNVVKFVHRKAIKDVVFKGYLIPSGWKVLPIFAAAHFDPSVHDNPLEFNPWRWENQVLNKKATPFGGGLRVCPGGDVAKLEISFFLHHLVLNYRWKPDGGEHPLAYPYVEFKRGLPLEIKPRKMENKTWLFTPQPGM